MAKPLVSDELWAILQPLIPPRKPRRFRYPGRKPIDDRKALTGILFVLKTGIPWQDLPVEMGCGCGMTCWRRLRDWNEAGVWTRLHQVLLQRLDDAHRINWTRAAIDSTFARAFEGVEGSGKNPTDRGRRAAAGTTSSASQRGRAGAAPRAGWPRRLIRARTAATSSCPRPGGRTGHTPGCRAWNLTAHPNGSPSRHRG